MGRSSFLLAILCVYLTGCASSTMKPIVSSEDAHTFQPPALWEYTAPLISPETRDQEPSRAQKDPSIVFHDGKWHVFMTVKLPDRTAVEYCSFDRWENANACQRTLLKVSDSKYFGAPQVFHFQPHDKWYLVYQMSMLGAKKMW